MASQIEGRNMVVDQNKEDYVENTDVYIAQICSAVAVSQTVRYK